MGDNRMAIHDLEATSPGKFDILPVLEWEYDTAAT